MASEVDICNIGLSNIRAGGINSLNEASLQAQQCKLKYPYVRDMVLKDAPWKFAHKLAPAALLVDTVFNWKYAYQYPADCLHINRLVLNVELFSTAMLHRFDAYDVTLPDIRKQVDYDVFNINGNRVITSNEAELRIDYRSRVTDPNLFDSQFIMALSWLMAAELAVPVVGAETGRAFRKDALSMYSSLISAAAASNGNQRYSAPVESEFVTARR